MTNTQTATTTFFHDMPAMSHIRHITDLSYYQDVPPDWLIAITDVRNSTIAIQNGKYKSVNTCGAATIAAILNAIPNIDVPFLFGGDGAAVVIPPHVRQQTADALIAVQQLAKDQFDLDLRIGIVPVADVLHSGSDIKVGKVYMSDNFAQPVFTGGGLEYADKLVKSPEHGHQYQVVAKGGETADFSGFECRWSSHPASSDEVISVLIKATIPNIDSNIRMYDTILDEIHTIYGEHNDRHPINLAKMMVAWNPSDYLYETGIRTENPTWRDRLKLMSWAVSGYILWRYVNKIWDQYKSTVYHSTDHEKFDDMLRMTISGTQEQRRRLLKFLEKHHDHGDIVYGIHVTDHSLMTCIVFDRFGRQVHFVDAGEGGYAMAALGLKKQLKAMQPEQSAQSMITSEMPTLRTTDSV